MKTGLDGTKTTGNMIPVGIALGVLSWILDTVWDISMPGQDSFTGQLFSPTFRELAARSITLFIFLGFGIYCNALMAKMKKSEMRVAESEARYRDLFDNANDLIQSIAPDGRILYVNRSWQETLGYTKEEAAALTMNEIIHPDLRTHCAEMFQRVMRGENLDRIETVFLTKDGRSVFVDGSVNCSIVDGKPVATRGIFRNVTGHRKAEEFVKTVLDTVDEGFIIVSPDFRVLSANRAFCEKLRLSPADVIGQPCHEVTHHCSSPCFESGGECAVQRVFETGEPHSSVHEHHDREGGLVHVEIKAFPFRDSLGRITSAIEIHNDITERRKLEAQLLHAQKMEAVGTLAGGVAHDFNNILTAIIGYANLVQMKLPQPDPLRPMVEQILASTERAANLTKSLLAFSRKQAITLKNVDVNELVHRTERLISRLIGEDIQVSTAVAEGETCIRADAGQIEQVLINLATNARDAMPQGGRLTIRTGVVDLDQEFIKMHGYGRKGRFVLVSVEDTGQGMERKVLQRIFEPFFTTKPMGKGTGLGLSIVYGIVKQHGGFINVYSEPGAGTVFRVYLPKVEPAASQQKREESAVPAGGSATILLAEDDDLVRSMSRRVLEAFGYQVVEAADGDDAVAKFQAHPGEIQLLILDVIMPGKGGKETCDAIRAMSPGIKALFMSGYTEEIVRKRGLLDETCHFLSKPASPTELLNKVAEVMRQPSSPSGFDAVASRTP